MKKKMVKCGPQKYKAYIKPVGKGYEVGFMYGSKPLFVGNFINNSEAQNWYKIMNREFSHFSKKFWHTPAPKAATVFYHRFITNTLYKHYYDYLDKCFGKYTKSYHQEYSRNVRTYNRLKKNWAPKNSLPYVRRAA
ncbi:MAG: hypothetical protein A2Z20_12960 [Bdellovibrionales bacterium RBG_16_40_8]|nr:MAG: hypothetical protein A2Z20_12960 [Bdellovibrionales bacterium RBG_16_40_8]